ncbi:MAG TPA: hypothetical protein VFQ38_11225 [Longimicrobiales bacterium]|nr:hypothetical protein [Longimicrobiales bacterium]
MSATLSMRRAALPARRRLAQAAECAFALILLYFLAGLPLRGGPELYVRQMLLAAGIGAAAGTAWAIGRGGRAGSIAASTLAALVVALEAAWLPTLVRICYTTASGILEVALIALAGALQVLAVAMLAAPSGSRPRARGGAGGGRRASGERPARRTVRRPNGGGDT